MSDDSKLKPREREKMEEDPELFFFESSLAKKQEGTAEAKAMATEAVGNAEAKKIQAQGGKR